MGPYHLLNDKNPIVLFRLFFYHFHLFQKIELCRLLSDARKDSSICLQVITELYQRYIETITSSDADDYDTYISSDLISFLINTFGTVTNPTVMVYSLISFFFPFTLHNCIFFLENCISPYFATA